MHLPGLLLVLMTSSLFVASANQTSLDAPLKRRCQFLHERDLTFLCTALYPKEAKIKYKDQLIDPGTVYSVFMVDGETNRYFLTFHNSPLHSCPRLHFISQQLAQCVTPTTSPASPTSSTVSLWNSELHCFAFTLQLVEDLVEYCLEHKGRPRGITTDLNVMTALHYSDPLSWASGATRRGLAQSSAVVLMMLLVVEEMWRLWAR